MHCVTGKNGYATEELAREALIDHHVRNSHREGKGPVNIYLCNDCNEWHFTSKGDVAAFLKEEKVVEKIRREGRAFEWERRLK